MFVILNLISLLLLGLTISLFPFLMMHITSEYILVFCYLNSYLRFFSKLIEIIRFLRVPADTGCKGRWMLYWNERR